MKNESAASAGYFKGISITVRKFSRFAKGGIAHCHFFLFSYANASARMVFYDQLDKICSVISSLCHMQHGGHQFLLYLYLRRVQISVRLGALFEDC